MKLNVSFIHDLDSNIQGSALLCGRYGVKESGKWQLLQYNQCKKENSFELIKISDFAFKL